MNVTLDILAERIDNLMREMKEGFKGVHERQDKTNGNVKLNTEARLKNEKPLKFMQKAIVGTMFAICGSVGFAILYLVIK